jgi:hypothetical protein
MPLAPIDGIQGAFKGVSINVYEHKENGFGFRSQHWVSRQSATSGRAGGFPMN